MSQPSAALVPSDLSWVRIIGEGAARWDVTPLAGAEVTARSLRARADEAARWIAGQPGIRRRLGVMVVDVNESICAWLRVPSLAPPVVAATLRASAQDWGDLMPVASFEALADPRPAIRGKRTKNAGAPAEDLENGVALGVLCMPDAIVRLALDALDAVNVRVGSVVSLWHAMARVWGDDAGSDSITASVLVDTDQRLVWAWSQGGNLLCGGSVTLVQPPESQNADAGPVDVPENEESHKLVAAGKRLTLDWLTWSQHLGRVPEKAFIVGLGAEHLASALRERWTACRVDTRSQTDAVAHAVQQFIGLSSESADAGPRRILTGLSHRPTRSVRARYRLTAGMLALAGVCIGLLGWRLGSAGDAMAATALEVRAQTRADARKEVPELPEVGSLLELKQMLDASAGKPVEAFKPPPLPRPIFEEFGRVVSILEKYPEVRINGIAFDQEATGQCRLTLRAPDRRTATEIFEAIKGTGKPIEWTRQLSGAGAAGAFDDVNLVGRWTD